VRGFSTPQTPHFILVSRRSRRMGSLPLNVLRSADRLPGLLALHGVVGSWSCFAVELVCWGLLGIEREEVFLVEDAWQEEQANRH
jgi:hypothetical protein